jgi:hypothetical protein
VVSYKDILASDTVRGIAMWIRIEEPRLLSEGGSPTSGGRDFWKRRNVNLLRWSEVRQKKKSRRDRLDAITWRKD